MKKLAEACKGCKGDLSKMLGKLSAAKLIDAEFLKKCAAGMCDLAGMLKECDGTMSIRGSDGTRSGRPAAAAERARRPAAAA